MTHRLRSTSTSNAGSITMTTALRSGRSRTLITPAEAAAAHLMLRVTAFAETIRLLPPASEAGTDPATFEAALESLARAGVARHLSAIERGPLTAERMAELAGAALAAIEESPMPDAEWTPLDELLGEELPPLLGVSTSSVARYRAGQRATPDPVAARLHVVTQIVADLSGSYNDFGIRRWFTRPRRALDGRSPRDVLTGDWTPEADDVVRVRELARALLGAAVA